MAQTGVTVHDTGMGYTARLRQGLHCTTQMMVTLHDTDKVTLQNRNKGYTAQHRQELHCMTLTGITLHDTGRGYTE